MMTTLMKTGHYEIVETVRLDSSNKRYIGCPVENDQERWPFLLSNFSLDHLKAMVGFVQMTDERHSVDGWQMRLKSALLAD